ncbi:MAG TPA: hypothetical protein PLL78_08385 [Fimbriimonadaceae bacterium]|nr:hypothetical protein [Fimbriimonadaceae bacterium]HRJ96693.1 hypothetical protein [Fimbriimonadaceae bacterium]
MRRGSLLRRLNRFLLKRFVPRFALRRVLLMAQAGGYALQASGVLFISAALAGSANAWLHGSEGTLLYFRVLLEPARSIAALVITAWVFPEAFPSPRRALMFSVILPTLFVALLVGLKIVAEGAGPPLVRFGEAQRADVMWRDPRFLAVVWALQVPLLYSTARLRR